jgi:hypothetical protein
MDSLYVGCENAVAFQYACIATNQNYEPSADFNVSHGMDVETTPSIPPSVPEMVKNCNGNLCNYTPAEIEVLEQATRKQYDSDAWIQHRIGRITGSVCHSVLTAARKL